MLLADGSPPGKSEFPTALQFAHSCSPLARTRRAEAADGLSPGSPLVSPANSICKESESAPRNFGSRSTVKGERQLEHRRRSRAPADSPFRRSENGSESRGRDDAGYPTRKSPGAVNLSSPPSKESNQEDLLVFASPRAEPLDLVYSRRDSRLVNQDRYRLDSPPRFRKSAMDDDGSEEQLRTQQHSNVFSLASTVRNMLQAGQDARDGKSSPALAPSSPIAGDVSSEDRGLPSLDGPPRRARGNQAPADSQLSLMDAESSREQESESEKMWRIVEALRNKSSILRDR